MTLVDCEVIEEVVGRFSSKQPTIILGGDFNCG